MNYRLIAADIDGTLLDSDGRITGPVKEAIKMVVKKGIVFTISTGRPIQGVKFIVEQLDIDIPLITHNGAAVLKGKSGEILYQQTMTPSSVKNIYQLGMEKNTMVIIWANNKLYVSEVNHKTRGYSGISGVEPLPVDNICRIIQEGVTKMIWYDDIETIDRLKEELEHYIAPDTNYHTSRPYFLEFVHSKASKAIAMDKLGQHYSISSDEMIAVGDGYNDLSMIEYAGLGVAMGNAPEGIKEKADYVTLTNDEDGLAHVIYKFI